MVNTQTPSKNKQCLSLAILGHVDQTFHYCCLGKAGEFKLIEIPSQQSVQEKMVHEANQSALQCNQGNTPGLEASGHIAFPDITFCPTERTPLMIISSQPEQDNLRVVAKSGVSQVSF